MRIKNHIGTCNKVCVICDNSFDSFKSDKRKYCSRACYDVSPTRGVRPKNRINKICIYCGKEFQRPAGNFKAYVKNHFCSMPCSRKFFAENPLIGENNPNWAGGYTQKEYNAGWAKLKRYVRKRAESKCEICGGTHKLMDVHHLIPVRLKVDIKIINHVDNLQFLCRPCHIEADRILRGSYPHQKAIAV